MSNTIRKFLRGRDLTAVTITPETESGGTLTDGTPVSLSGHCRSVRLSYQKNTENIMSVEDTHENHVPIYDGFTVTVTELVLLAGSALPADVMTYDYYKIQWTQGANLVTAWGVCTGFDMGVDGQGSQTITATFSAINNTGSASLTLT